MSVGGGAPRRTSAREPSANTQSSARTHERIEPKRIECDPAAFVDAIPPTVQNAPLDGSTGKRSPCARAARSTSARTAPGRTRIVRAASSTGPIVRQRLRSTITPSPIAPPGMLLPDPRGMSGVRVDAAHATSVDEIVGVDRHGDGARQDARDSRRLGVHGARVVVDSKYAAKSLGAVRGIVCSGGRDAIRVSVCYLAVVAGVV